MSMHELMALYCAMTHDTLRAWRYVFLGDH